MKINTKDDESIPKDSEGSTSLVTWHGFIAPIATLAFGLLLLVAIVMTAVDVFRTKDSSVPGLADAVELAKAIVWPVALLFLISYFHQPILHFLERLSKVTLKAGEAEATLEAQDKREKVSSLLGAAEATATSLTSAQLLESGPGSTTVFNKIFVAPAGETSLPSPRRLVDSLSRLDEIVNVQTIDKLAKGSVLWVDDKPENNAYLIQAFRELGMRVDLAKSTDDALRRIEATQYDVIVTDMSRPPDAMAGYTLLSDLRKAGHWLPVIVYAGSDSEEHRKMAKKAGAIESTSRPQRVFDLVTDIVRGRRPQRQEIADEGLHETSDP